MSGVHGAVDVDPAAGAMRWPPLGICWPPDEEDGSGAPALLDAELAKLTLRYITGLVWTRLGLGGKKMKFSGYRFWPAPRHLCAIQAQ